MRSIKYYFRTVSGLLAIALVAAFAPTQVFAQDNERTFIQVRTIHVKGGMVSEYIELQNQFNRSTKSRRTAGT